jgi:hypothetical protein
MMNTDEIDRMLSREDEILPSSGFTASVMESVRREAAAPPPIPFPWRRALPGMVVAGVALPLAGWVSVAASAQVVRAGAPMHSFAAWAPEQMKLLSAAVSPAGLWIVVGLAVSLASIVFSLRLGSKAA